MSFATKKRNHQKGVKVKNYLKEQIQENDKRAAAHKHLDPASAEYWKGRGDSYRDILLLLEADEKPPNPGKLKVWGVAGFDDQGNQGRCVVAVRTKKEAAKAFKCTTFHLGKYGAVTANTKEIELALQNPGKVIFTEKMK